MNNKENSNEIELKRYFFSLTKSQRIINPIGRFIIVVLLPLIFGISYFASFQDEIDVLSYLFSFFIYYILLWRLGILLPMFYMIFSTSYINTLAIGDKCVYFGVDNLELAQDRKLFKVKKGLIGVNNLIDTFGTVIVIPNDVISYDNLKYLIENKE